MQELTWALGWGGDWSSECREPQLRASWYQNEVLHRRMVISFDISKIATLGFALLSHVPFSFSRKCQWFCVLAHSCTLLINVDPQFFTKRLSFSKSIFQEHSIHSREISQLLLSLKPSIAFHRFHRLFVFSLQFFFLVVLFHSSGS